MTTNTHILTIDKHLGEMRAVVRGMAEGEEKQQLAQLLEVVTNEMFAAQTEFTVQIAELNRQLYEPIVKAQEGTCCRYIDVDALIKGGVYTLDEFKKKLQQACESEARVLGAFLHKYEKIGYLDFHGESKKKILKHLQNGFPTMRKYGYPNFAAAF